VSNRVSASTIDRRVGLIAALVLAILAAALGSRAQENPAGTRVRIGRLSPLSAETDAPNVAGFRTGMRELGWVEGQSFTIESRFADGKHERLPQLAADLVRQRVDLILVGSNQGALAAKQATDAVPIVMVTTGDPVGGGIVASLARPGGNITGITALGQALSGKRLELIKEAVPGVTRVMILSNPASPYTAPFVRERDSLARALGLHLGVIDVRGPEELDKAFQTVAAERAGAIMVLTDVMLVTHRRRIVQLAARQRLPGIYGEREFVDAGGLMFYGAPLATMYHDAAVYADRILKGARPGELPVAQPTRLELAVNLKAAKEISLTVPPALLGRADRILR
jgi:putative tryptophan/tyrosine transport system substrate-binding protein